jgi:UDP-N-acetylmuramate dehydrogenase
MLPSSLPLIEEQAPIPNTFGLTVKATRMVTYRTVAELKQYLADGRQEEPYLHIGDGSNLLFQGDYEGTVLRSAIQTTELIQEDDTHVLLRVGGGIGWDTFVATCVAQGWYGAENLSLIPGTVGAAAVQNIGAYGVEVCDLIQRVETINAAGVTRTYEANECRYSYRHSLFKEPAMSQTFVTRVELLLSKKEHYTLDYHALREEAEQQKHLDLATVRRLVIGIRERKLPDPRRLGNAGSFFMNPVISADCYRQLQKEYPRMPHYALASGAVKVPAAWLIEQCGWKGKSCGAAAVYEHQPLVLVNNGGATGDDIIRLSEQIRLSVHQRFGIDIRPEVRIIPKEI